MLIDADWCWLMLILINSYRFWFMLIDADWWSNNVQPGSERIDADWCWLMLIDAAWCLLMLIAADWCWLMLINSDQFLSLLIYADWWSNKVQPGSEHTFGVSLVIYCCVAVMNLERFFNAVFYVGRCANKCFTNFLFLSWAGFLKCFNVLVWNFWKHGFSPPPTVHQKRGHEGQFRFWPYSSFLWL